MHRLGFSHSLHNRMRSSPVGADNRSIWVHALSVGEVLSAVYLVKTLKVRANGRPIIFSAATQTGFDIANKSLGRVVDRVVFAPYDIGFSVRRVVKRIDPAVCIIIETDIWPNFLNHLKRKRIPVFLVNARLSDRSFNGYRRFSFFIKPLLSIFHAVCTQSPGDAHRFMKLGVDSDRVAVTGNLKFDQEIDPLTEKELGDLRKMLHIRRDRQILVAGSTHEDEESSLCRAVVKLKRTHPSLALILAPRDIIRASALRSLFARNGLRTICLKEAAYQGILKPPDVVIIDRIGLLRKLYALANVAFIGGSLVKLGGHNPLEPAAYAKPIIFGPYMHNFKEITSRLLKAQGAISVASDSDIVQNVKQLLDQPALGRQMGKEAKRVISENSGTVSNTVQLLFETLSRDDRETTTEINPTFIQGAYVKQ